MDNRTQQDPGSTGSVPTVPDETVVGAPAVKGRLPEWFVQARAGISQPGKYIAYEDDDRAIVVPVEREWTRIGRSLAADIRFDDATVSRRHALMVSQADGVRVLDDRSLNGVYVNGRRVEWSPLTDGDEITVGRHSLFFVDATPAETRAEPAAAAAD
jgi:pSer/pThr/pTyr-binding forkhead associated (FHA) protein